jgi:hypothetical protein
VGCAEGHVKWFGISLDERSANVILRNLRQAATPSALHFLYVRNKLANPSFAYAVQRVTQYGSPAAAAAVTGPYYPRAAVCALSTLTAKGPQACLPHP